MANAEIKKFAKENHVRLWEVADRLNVADTTFSKKLRRELLPEEKSTIMSIISDIAKEERN